MARSTRWVPASPKNQVDPSADTEIALPVNNSAIAGAPKTKSIHQRILKFQSTVLSASALEPKNQVDPSADTEIANHRPRRHTCQNPKNQVDPSADTEIQVIGQILRQPTDPKNQVDPSADTEIWLRVPPRQPGQVPQKPSRSISGY